MAQQLYKRYIPPKASIPAAPEAPVVQQKQKSVDPQSDDGPKKRKRERTEEEVAERKAKKLRKKGIDPDTLPAVQKEPSKKASKEPSKKPSKVPSTTRSDEQPVEAAPVEAFSDAPDVPEEARAEAQGEFAHIKSAKKRHKLQKQARKERKAGGAGEEHSGNHEESPTLENGRQQVRGDAEPSSNAEDVRMTDQNEIEQVTSVQINGETLKAKRKSKREKKTSPTVDESSVRDAAPADPPFDEARSQPKKRRHKLEAILQGTANNEEAETEADNDQLRKHGGILKRYQTSISTEIASPIEEPASDRPQPTILDLAPLPQPEPAPTPTFIPDAAATPSWIANPTIISNSDTTLFVDLNLDPKTVDHLKKLNFATALPVQKSLIPLLLPPGIPGSVHLPGTESLLPDIAVSAPTGSGKTIGYLLPIIESLKKESAGNGKLSALVVVPTRELVAQVAAVAESLAKGTQVKAGMVTGVGAFKEEQGRVVRRGRRYDPAGYRTLVAKAHRRNFGGGGDDDDDELMVELENETPKDIQLLDDTVTGLVNHVPVYESTYQILIATPGRLLEHLNNTLGFTLAHLRYLVLDEADKLLDLQYNNFLSTINAALARPHDEGEQDARERYLRRVGAWEEGRERSVRKVVLSATMTRDISKLVGVGLVRPRMVVVRGTGQADEDVVKEETLDGEFELPATLREYCVPVGDGGERPLFLVELLRGRILSTFESEGGHDYGSGDATVGADVDASSSESDTSSDSDSDSDSHSDSISSSSSDDSDVDMEDQLHPDSKHAEPTTPEPLIDHAPIHPSRAAAIFDHATTTVPTILIFTSSTESTHRLTYLLQHLLSAWSPYITSMTRGSDSKTRKAKSPAHSDPTKPLITISTDRAARGLDALYGRDITHVIQYDVPRSLTSYIHRVGRTARAGRGGEAWTLYSGSEARWFLKEVAGGKSVERGGEVGRVKLVVKDEGLRERLGEVVEEMRGVVLGGNKKG